jgi:hypothetical protein
MIQFLKSQGEIESKVQKNQGESEVIFLKKLGQN